MLNAIKYGGDRDQHAAHGYEPASARPAHGVSRKNPASAPECHFADSQRPSKPISGVGESSRDVHHRHKKKHRDPPQEAGPAHQNFCGNAQRGGQQRKAEEIPPKQWPRHVRGYHGRDEFYGREMQGAERRQGDGETQIAQGYKLVQAAGLRDIVSGSPQSNHENYDPGTTHRNYRAVDPPKCRESYMHLDFKRELACSFWDTLPRSITLQTVQRRGGEHAF